MKKKIKHNYNKDYIYYIQNKNIGINELKVLFYNVRKTKINPTQIFVATTINLLRALNILFLKR